MKKYYLLILTLFIFTLGSCIHSRYLVYPRFGHLFQENKSMIIVSKNSYGLLDFELEKKVMKSISHCNLKFLNLNKASDLLYKNLMPIDMINFSDSISLLKVKKITNCDYILLLEPNYQNQFYNNLWEKKRSIGPQFQYNIGIYDLNSGTQVLSIETKTTATGFKIIDDDEIPDDFGLNKGIVKIKTIKRSMKKLSESCKCYH